MFHYKIKEKTKNVIKEKKCFLFIRFKQSKQHILKRWGIGKISIEHINNFPKCY